MNKIEYKRVMVFGVHFGTYIWLNGVRLEGVFDVKWEPRTHQEVGQLTLVLHVDDAPTERQDDAEEPAVMPNEWSKP